MSELTEAERVLGFSLWAFKELDVMAILKSYVSFLHPRLRKSKILKWKR